MLNLCFCACWFNNQDDGSPVSIFSLSGSNAQDGHLAAGRNGVKRLRTVSYEWPLYLNECHILTTIASLIFYQQ